MSTAKARRRSRANGGTKIAEKAAAAVAAPSDKAAGEGAAEKPKRRHVNRPPSDPRVARGENGQRRIYVQRPQMMPSGPVDWLSRLFQ